MANYVLADGASAGGPILGILLLIAVIAAWSAYNKFKANGFRPRQVTTHLSPSDLASIFEQKVCGMGWTIIDHGNPMVAQSSLVAGIRQQIALDVTDTGPTRTARIYVTRYSKKMSGGATKAYTLRMRMSGFLAEVQRRDAAATVAG